MKQRRLIVDEKSIKEFVEYLAANGAEPHTQKRYEHDIKMFAGFLGEHKISQKIKGLQGRKACGIQPGNR